MENKEHSTPYCPWNPLWLCVSKELKRDNAWLRMMVGISVVWGPWQQPASSPLLPTDRINSSAGVAQKLKHILLFHLSLPPHSKILKGKNLSCSFWYLHHLVMLNKCWVDVCLVCFCTWPDNQADQATSKDAEWGGNGRHRWRWAELSIHWQSWVIRDQSSVWIKLQDRAERTEAFESDEVVPTPVRLALWCGDPNPCEPQPFL